VPNQKKSRRNNTSVTIDSFGLRSTRDWSEEADSYILFVGDSVTWGGTNIDDTQIFSYITCDILEKKFNKKFTCGNAGVNGYGTDNMAERIKYKKFNSEDIIVITLISNDTIRGLADIRSAHFFTKPPQRPFNAIREAAAFYLFKKSFNMRHNYLKNYFNDDDLSVAEESLSRLLKAAREKKAEGKEVIFILSPVEKELHNRESSLTRHVKSILISSGEFSVIDLNKIVSDNYSPDIYYDGVHLDIRGNQLYADVIAEHLSHMIEYPDHN